MRFLLVILLVALVVGVSDARDPKKKRKKNDVTCDCLDICFNLDTSGSISNDEWDQIIAFICQFMDQFTNPPDDIHFCAIEFSREANTVLYFNDPCNSNPTYTQCKSKIAALTRQRENTNHEEALLLALAHFPSDGDRPDDECPDVHILITDGKTVGGGDPEPIARRLEQDRGVTNIVIGIGNDLDVPALEAIAGDPERVFLTGFDQLPDIVRELRSAVCQSDEFDPYCQTCCCGSIYGDHHNQLPDRKHKCCGKTYWNPKKTQAVCCQGNFFEGYDEKWTRCCYGQPYDIRYYTCCYNVVVPATRSQDQCCGFTAFNQKHEICCYGRVYRKNKHTQCCFRVAYNRKQQICCRYTVNDGCSKEYRCCGRVAYNPKTHICGNPFYNHIRPSPTKYCGQDITLPCGRKNVWDPLWNTCCFGKVWPGGVTHDTGCCRRQRISLQNQLCCDGRVHDLDPEWFQCCGHQAYDPWDQTCCHGYFVVNKKGLCCGYFQVFDHRTQICCGGRYVFNGRPCRTKCCYSYYFGYRPYNIKRELCCRGFIQRGGPHWYCCGYYSYNIKTHMCCYGRIFPRKLFRYLGYCDLIRDVPGDNPFEKLDAATSQDEAEPSDDEDGTPPPAEDLQEDMDATPPGEDEPEAEAGDAAESGDGSGDA